MHVLDAFERDAAVLTTPLARLLIESYRIRTYDPDILRSSQERVKLSVAH